MNLSDPNGHKDPDSGGEISGVRDHKTADIYAHGYGDYLSRPGNPTTGGVGNYSVSGMTGQDLLANFSEHVRSGIVNSDVYKQKVESDAFAKNPIGYTLSKTPLCAFGPAGAAERILAKSLLAESACLAGPKAVGSELGNLNKVGDYLSSKAPLQVGPGTKTLTGQHVNDLGRVEPWKASYDQSGRLVGRTDYNAGNAAYQIHITMNTSTALV